LKKYHKLNPNSLISQGDWICTPCALIFCPVGARINIAEQRETTLNSREFNDSDPSWLPGTGGASQDSGLMV